jgi:hypothetical protein
MENMKKLSNIMAIVAIGILLASCSASKVVTTETDKEADFTAFKTYQFPGINVEYEQVLKENRLDMIIEEIEKEMSLRGYSKVEGNADLLLNVGIVIEERVQTRDTDVRESPRYMGQRRYSWQSQEVEVSRYTVGSITMDAVDISSNSMVWYGVVERIVKEKTDDEKAKKNIEEAVSVLFKKYPVKPTE